MTIADLIASAQLSGRPGMNIEDVLARRTDLSTFLVHLTRETETGSAEENLGSILAHGCIKAFSPFGSAVRHLNARQLQTESQNCVCFTETPLEHVSLIAERINGRRCQFEPYGIVITKKQGRKQGVNPIWYVDITPDRDGLMRPLDTMVEACIDAKRRENKQFSDHLFSKITPFIEQMGTDQGNKKEFWWEREWRHVGHFDLPDRVFVFCPANKFEKFRGLVEGVPKNERKFEAKFTDPSWSLEKMFGRLAGFSEDDLGHF